MPITRPLRQRMKGIVVGDVDVSRPRLHLNRGLVVAGAVLIGVGGVLGATGILLGTYAVVNASRDWMSQLEVPPGEIARRKLQQARMASVAAADAWRQKSRESASG
jgi:hypothetical protein